MRLGIDVGGTFTDFILLDPDRRFLAVGKQLTTPADPSVAALEGTAALCAEHGRPAAQLRHAVHGATLVANTIIERKGAPTGLIATHGFRDALETGREIRYDMYDMFIERSAPLVPRHLRLEVNERLGPDGRVLRPLDLGELEAIVRTFEREGVKAVAVSLMHAFRNPAHECAIGRWLGEHAPELHVSLSTAVCPEIREYERTSTTVANAYVQPIISRYLGRLKDGLSAQGLGGPLYIMLSGGGINSVEYAQHLPIHMIESGPAGGAKAASFIGHRAGLDRLLAFDMGGTTAKLCLIEGGEPYRVNTFEAARIHRFMKGSGLQLKVPVIEMIEVGAGGGSIARADRLGVLKVGPQSAGSVPGPACYSRGGREPTVTDADLLLGYLDPAYFLGGRMSLDPDRAAGALVEQVATPLGLTPLEAARGVFELVDENMAAAARVYLAERGRDPRQYTFLAFGGAGPVHAWDLARRLKMRRILCPPAAGAAAALGFLVAAPTVDLVMSHVSRLEEIRPDFVLDILGRLNDQAAQILAGAGVPGEEVHAEISADIRYVGQGYEIPVPIDRGVVESGPRGLQAAFDAEYERVFGRAVSSVAAEVLTWRIRARGPSPVSDWHVGSTGTSDAGAALKGRRPAYFDAADRPIETPVFDRYRLGPGAQFSGPAIVEERESTAIVPPGAQATIDAFHNLLIELAS